LQHCRVQEFRSNNGLRNAQQIPQSGFKTVLNEKNLCKSSFSDSIKRVKPTKHQGYRGNNLHAQDAIKDAGSMPD